MDTQKLISIFWIIWNLANWYRLQECTICSENPEIQAVIFGCAAFLTWYVNACGCSSFFGLNLIFFIAVGEYSNSRHLGYIKNTTF